MAKSYGVAGEWARVKGSVAGLWPLFVGVFAAGFSLATWCFRSPGVGAVAFVLSLVAIGIALLKGLRHVERFFKGAKGEERVAGVLMSLPDTYHVFNDFVAGRTHVDHVVVGPAGVFAVETKCWSGTVTIEEGHILVNGSLPSRPPLAQAVREAELVRTALAARGWVGPVTPILAFASDNFTARIAEIDGAVVINSCELLKAFVGGRETIPAAERIRLVSLMES